VWWITINGVKKYTEIWHHIPFLVEIEHINSGVFKSFGAVNIQYLPLWSMHTVATRTSPTSYTLLWITERKVQEECHSICPQFYIIVKILKYFTYYFLTGTNNLIWTMNFSDSDSGSASQKYIIEFTWKHGVCGDTTNDVWNSIEDYVLCVLHVHMWETDYIGKAGCLNTILTFIIFYCVIFWSFIIHYINTFVSTEYNSNFSKFCRWHVMNRT
jgi:hypothetical protein